MTNDNHSTTGITQIVGGGKDKSSPPLMSYTAVTSHQEMATALVNHLLSFCRQLIPDRDMTIEDLVSVCHTALERKMNATSVLEGKYLRPRISDQLSRARRYQELFSIVVIKLVHSTSDESYHTIVDALEEKLRQTDMVFTFKHRLVLLLPHTDATGTVQFLDRVSTLLDTTVSISPIEEITYLPFPSPKIKRSSQVLDWTENQLR